MTRVQALFSAVLASAVVAQAAPPVVTVDAEIQGEVGDFVAVKAKVTAAKAVKFVALDAGLRMFPAGLLADPTATVVTSPKPGKFRVLCYSGNQDGPSEPVTTTVVIGNPPPTPVDPVDPEEPDDKDAPFKGVSGLHVLLIYEQADLAKLPAKQLAIFNGSEVSDALNKHCPLGGDGVKTWRALDKDTKVTGVWGDAMNRDRKSVPWVVLGNGKAGYEGPLPESPEKMVELITKYKGE